MEMITEHLKYGYVLSQAGIKEGVPCILGYLTAPFIDTPKLSITFVKNSTNSSLSDESSTEKHTTVQDNPQRELPQVIVEAVKKKRGRPKKVKQTDVIVA